MAQWHTDLQEYDFVIKHIPGKINTPADKLSCPPNSDQGKNNNQDQTLLEPKIFVNTTHLLTLPESSKRNLMTLIHDHPTARHPGQDETIRKAMEILPWTRMCQWISDYIKGCTICQQNKILTHRPKIPLYWITTKEGCHWTGSSVSCFSDKAICLSSGDLGDGISQEIQLRLAHILDQR